MPTTYSPYKNESREGARPMSFWLRRDEVNYLDELAERSGVTRAEALRTLIHAARQNAAA